MKLFLKVFFYSITLTSFLSQAVSSDSSLPIQKITEKAQQIVNDDNIVGLSMTIFSSKEILVSKGLGLEKRGETKAVLANQTQFRWNSNSKLFVAVAIAKLIDQGHLNLDDSILALKDVNFVRYLYRNETVERLKQWKKIKIKHLLLHQAGISKDLPGSRVFWNSFSIQDNALPSQEDLLKGLLSVEFIFEPGHTQGAIKYSNLGMNLLARIVEGMNPEQLPFPEYVKKYIFQPLKMSQSTYDVTDTDNLSPGYGTTQLNGKYLELPHILKVGSYDGSIGVTSTSEDMALFGQELLKASRYQSNLLFSSTEIAQYFLTPPEKNSFISPGRIMGPGIFWRFRPVKETRAENLWVGHTGLGYGMESIVLVNPSQNIGVAIVSNTQDKTFPAFELWDFIVSKIKESPEKEANKELRNHLDLVTRRLKKSESKVSFTETLGQTVSASDLEKFAGTYFADNSIQGPEKKFILETDEAGQTHLYFELIPGKVKFRLIPEDLSKGIFRIEKVIDLLFHAERVEFLLDNSGKVTGVIIAQAKELSRLN